MWKTVSLTKQKSEYCTQIYEAQCVEQFYKQRILGEKYIKTINCYIDIQIVTQNRNNKKSPVIPTLTKESRTNMVSDSFLLCPTD